MNALAPCPSCDRHVRALDDACPFCGAPTRAVERVRVLHRLGRAALFTFGAAIAGTPGCGTSTTPPTDGGGVDDGGHDAAASTDDANVMPTQDAGADAGVDAGRDAAPSTTDAGPPDDAAEDDAGFHPPYGAPPPPPDPED